MKKVDLERNLWERITRPWTWATILGFAAPFVLLRSWIFWHQQLNHPLTLAGAVLVPIFVSMGFTWTAPLAWRYTGDGRPIAGIIRGTLQSVVVNSIAVLLYVEVDVVLIDMSQAVKLHDLWVSAAVNGVILVPFMTLVGFFIATGEVSETEHKLAADQAKSAQDRALQHQLSPHVLFNALNGLAELVRQDPVAAEQGILDLAELYRMVLDTGRLAWIPLKEEVRLVERFLAVEKLRLGDRLHVIWEWDDNLNSIMVPPLMLQPLVENAIKHGLSQRVEISKIYIVCRKVLGDVEVRVENQGEIVSKGGRKGVGLQNLTERLQLHFPAQSSVILESENGWVRAGFRIETRALGVA